MSRSNRHVKAKLKELKTISDNLVLPNELASWEVSLLAPMLAGIVGRPSEDASERREQEARHERQRRA
jgi:hypothetical protein